MNLYLQYHELVTFLDKDKFGLKLPTSWLFQIEQNLLFNLMILLATLSALMFFIISLTSCMLKKDDKNMKHLLTGVIVVSFLFTIPMLIMFGYVLIKINSFISSGFEINHHEYSIDVKKFQEYYHNILVSKNQELNELLENHPHINLIKNNISLDNSFVITKEGQLIFSPQYLVQYKLDIQTIQTKYILINSITFGLRVVSMLFVFSNTIRIKMQSRKELKRQKEIEVQEPILINQNPHIMR